jgi:hypothetical protein
MTRYEDGRRRGIWEAIASALLPGLGQLMKGDTDKAIALFIVWVACGISVLRHLPLLGPVIALIGAVTWLFAVIDAYVASPRR